MAFANPKTVKDIVTDFLSSAPTLEEIASYTLPDEFQDRAHELLDKNRNNRLSSDEHAEMEEIRQIDHLLTLIKTKAQLRISKSH